MGSGSSRVASADSLVARSTPVASADSPVVPHEALFSTPAAEATTLTSKAKRLDGLASSSTTLWYTGKQLVWSYKRSMVVLNKDGMVTTFKDGSGNVIALLKHGDVASYRRGTGHAILYAPRPPAGASAHASVEGLHAAYEIRLPDDVLEAYPVKQGPGGVMTSQGMQKGGLGFFAAGAAGAFSATSTYRFVGERDGLTRNKWIMLNAKGDSIGTYEDKTKKVIVAAAGVDAVLLVVFASVVFDYVATMCEDVG